MARSVLNRTISWFFFLLLFSWCWKPRSKLGYRFIVSHTHMLACLPSLFFHRCMPDFETFHALVGQASFGDSSNQHQHQHPGGNRFSQGGEDDVAAAVTGALFSRGASSQGGSGEPFLYCADASTAPDPHNSSLYIW